MKKLFFAAILATSIISCDHQGDATDISSPKKELSGKYLGKPSALAGKKGPVGISASFTFTAGRQSRNCHGFGICELTAFGIEIIELPEPPKPSTQIGQIGANEDGKYSAYIYLNEIVDEKEFDTNFYVDTDFEGKDEKGNVYVIKKGEYNLDQSIGKFGGYALDVDKVK